MELECGYSPQDETITILSFFGSPEQQPRQRSLLESYPWEEHCSETPLRSSPFVQTLITNYYTHTHTHKDMHSPPHSRSLASVALNRQPDKRVCDQRRNSGCGTGWLLAGAGLLPLWHSRVFMVYVLLCWGVFPVLTLCSPRSIVWGLFFFSSPSSCSAVFFLPLSTYISLLIIPCMIVYVTNNKEP